MRDDLEVFEFGSGNSTLFFASRGSRVTSVEHDQEWYTLLKSKAPPNVKLLFEELEYGGRYCETAVRTGIQYDLILVDGRDRVRSASNSIRALKAGGVLVLDNSDSPKYREVFDVMRCEGFRHIDFWGIGPLSLKETCTTIFYWPGNCLDL